MIQVNITKHAVGFPSKTLASSGGSIRFGTVRT